MQVDESGFDHYTLQLNGCVQGLKVPQKDFDEHREYV